MILDRGWREFQKKLRELESKKVDVGIQGDSNSEIVERGFFNEFGTQDIPERSFLRSTLTEKTNEIKKQVDNLVQNLSNIEVDQGLGRIGLYLETEIKKKVISGNFTPNSSITIAQKGSSKPLIDTGQMLNSIRFEIKG